MIEIHEPFNDHTTGTGTSAFLSFLPCGIDIFGLADGGLSVAGRTHHGFYYYGKTDFVDSVAEFFFGRSEAVRRCCQAQ